METNIAIIIAVSDYHHENPLPACRSDGELVQAIIVRTGKFAPENTLAMVSGTTSSEVKAQLAAFIQSHKGKTIGEVFFYFTGHGDFDGSDFRFVLSDFQADRRHQTTLGNSELDDMLRSLSPSIGVKLVDACHSGVQYVKDPDSIDKALQGTKEGYKSCYFMFSSDRNQFSYQDGNLSYFTRSFANAIANHTGPAIRYKDVIDYISDDFQNSRQQKPVFVVQASFTDEFCKIDPEMLLAIRHLLPHAATSSSTTTTTTTPAPFAVSFRDLLLKHVDDEAKRYCTKEEAFAAMEHVKAVVEKYQPDDALIPLYTFEPTFMKDSYDVPNELAIATWLKSNPNEYFVTLNYGTEDYEERIHVPKWAPFLNIQIGYEYQTVTRKRPVLAGFDTTGKAPFRCIHLQAAPAFQNLPWWRCYIAIVFSKAFLRCFHSFVRLKEVNWDTREVGGKVEWVTKECPMKRPEEVGKFVEGILTDFGATILKELKERFELADGTFQGSATSQVN